ncbi:MAG: glutamate--tRNA ligase [Candidatus Izemoplasmatales bacterium]|nr:glutamate--tRNA ligase [Candidatus Izemoplasmatales bacterium]
MKLRKELAHLLFPEVDKNISDLEKIYPNRQLSEDAMVTRFAPSPTGFLHTGSLFASMVSWRYAKQSNGVFFVRLEDTDTKREIEGSGDEVLTELNIFGINPDESFVTGGLYGPYVQSERKWIYDIVIKYMIENDLAYPCFCTHEELDEIRKKQESLKVNPGYYGEYAKCRKLSVEEMIQNIKNGESYVIRFKSMGNELEKIGFDDEIRGHIEFPQNVQDLVIMKGDKLPTYHFAHLVDDHFMRTTHVTRGEEWMSSVPIHLQLFDAMGWVRPKYAHLPVIMKMDDGKRRKLSKRKDEEASVKYFLEKGYPIEGFLEYLMTIANTNFEEWRIQNPFANIFDFNLTFDKMSLDGGLFDLEKIKSICKETLGNMPAPLIAKKALDWAKIYNQEFFQVASSNIQFFESILDIERGGEKPRKDYEKYSDIFPIINFMYDSEYESLLKDTLPFNERVSQQDIIDVLELFIKNNGLDLNEEEWFENLKVIASSLNYTPKSKEYKKNPELYKGHIGDFAEIIRISVSTKKSSPNFYYVLKILGKDKVISRLQKVISLLKD